LAKEELSQTKFYMMKQEFHWCDLDKHKLTTHDTWSDQQTTTETLGREEGIEHTNAQDGEDTTPTSLTTCSKTWGRRCLRGTLLLVVPSIEASHAQLETEATPEK
jgi:hypothetical protein